MNAAERIAETHGEGAGASADATVLIPGTLAPVVEGVKRILAERGYERTLYLGDITPEDIDSGYAHIDNDVCAATAAIAGQFIRYFEAHGTEGVAALAPEICRDCRSVSIPAVLPACFARSGYTDVEIVPLTSAETKSSAADIDDAVGAPATDAPVVGVCGNMPMVTTEEFRHVVVDHLREEGCQVVIPPVQAIANQQDFLTPAMEYFHERGVRTVICILPFGCLGGHVFARGQLRTMQKRFPEIGLTILDYDPSASDINLINRTELVIQAAKEQAAQVA